MARTRDRIQVPDRIPDGIESERRDVEAAIALIGLAVAPVRPPGRLRDRVIGSLVEDGSGTAGPMPVPVPLPLPLPLEVRPGISLVRSSLLPWGEPSEGVRLKNFWPDSSSEARSFLLELLPGSVFPDHDHNALEEVFVLRGSFSVAGQVLREGDFCRSEPGTRDWNISSEEGALLLVRLGSTRPPLFSAGIDGR
ncbi:MAG: cupin domain-containing protein [Acidobacteriota bacterium]